MTGFEWLLRCLRVPGRGPQCLRLALPWLLLALLCTGLDGRHAESIGGGWIHPAYAAEPAPAVADSAGRGSVSEWAAPRWLAVGLLIVLEALVIAGLVFERTRRARVESLLAERLR